MFVKIRNIVNETYNTEDRLIAYQRKSWIIVFSSVNVLLNVKVFKPRLDPHKVGGI